MDFFPAILCLSVLFSVSSFPSISVQFVPPAQKAQALFFFFAQPHFSFGVSLNSFFFSPSFLLSDLRHLMWLMSLMISFFFGISGIIESPLTQIASLKTNKQTRRITAVFFFFLSFALCGGHWLCFVCLTSSSCLNRWAWRCTLEIRAETEKLPKNEENNNNNNTNLIADSGSISLHVLT